MKNLKKDTRDILVSIFAVIKKDFKTLFRAKSSAFTIVIGPLIVMMLIFLAFNNASFFEVKMATYSSSYSELSNEIVTKLNSSGYIVNQVNNSSDCINGVKMGEFNVCLFFSENMKVANGANNNITVYVDSSRINIVDSITSNINKIVMNKSQGLSIELTNVLVNQLTLTSTTLKEKSEFITAINVNNNKIKENTNGAKTKLSLIDFNISYADFKIDVLKTELNKTNSTYTLSKTDFDNLNSKLNDIETKINSTLQKLSDVKTKVSDVSKDIDSIPNIADSNIQQANSLKGELDKVIAGINGISITNSDSIVSPIKTNVQPLVAEKTYIGRLLPTFLVLFIMFVCVLLASSLVLSEKSSSAYFRNSITSTPNFVFLIGTYLTSLILMLVQVLIIALGLYLFLDYNLIFLLPALIPLLLIASVFILIGISIGYFAKSQEGGNTFSLIVITIGIFFSNTILPVETIPVYLSKIVMYNPFVIGEAVLKKILIFNFSMLDAIWGIINLLIYILILVIISYIGLIRSRGRR